VLFVTEALQGVVPQIDSDLDPKFDSEQGRKQIFESRQEEEILNSTQNALLCKNALCPFKNKMHCYK
jgi:hypothetical protein